MIRPASLNKCFAAWVASMLPPSRQVTLAIDGKTIRSTGKMQSYDTALHIISAQIGELGMSYGQRSAEGKSNEIPAVRELLAELDILIFQIFTKQCLAKLVHCMAWNYQAAKQKTFGSTGDCGQWNFLKAV